MANHKNRQNAKPKKTNKPKGKSRMKEVSPEAAITTTVELDGDKEPIPFPDGEESTEGSAAGSAASDGGESLPTTPDVPPAPMVKCTPGQVIGIQLHVMKQRLAAVENERDNLEQRLANMEVELGQKRAELVSLRRENRNAIRAPRDVVEMNNYNKSVGLGDGNFRQHPKTGEWFEHKAHCTCPQCK